MTASSATGRRPKPATAARVLNWQPRSHVHVWCHALVTGVLCAAIWVASGRRPDAVAVLAASVVVTAGYGGWQSYRLSRRVDAAAGTEQAAGGAPSRTVAG